MNVYKNTVIHLTGEIDFFEIIDCAAEPSSLTILSIPSQKFYCVLFKFGKNSLRKYDVVHT